MYYNIYIYVHKHILIYCILYTNVTSYSDIHKIHAFLVSPTINYVDSMHFWSSIII